MWVFRTPEVFQIRTAQSTTHHPTGNVVPVDLVSETCPTSTHSHSHSHERRDDGSTAEADIVARRGVVVIAAAAVDTWPMILADTCHRTKSDNLWNHVFDVARGSWAMV